jgi:putative membrane protein
MEPMNTDEQKQLAQQRTDLAVQRNRLAAERTFLSWIRTGLAGVGGGVAIIKFLPFKQAAHRQLADWVGQLLVLWGIALFIYAAITYVQTCRRLSGTASCRSSSIGIMAIAFSLTILAILLFLIT